MFLHFPHSLLLSPSVTHSADVIKDHSFSLTVPTLLDFSPGIWTTSEGSVKYRLEDDISRDTVVIVWIFNVKEDGELSDSVAFGFGAPVLYHQWGVTERVNAVSCLSCAGLLVPCAVLHMHASLFLLLSGLPFLYFPVEFLIFFPAFYFLLPLYLT